MLGFAKRANLHDCVVDGDVYQAAATFDCQALWNAFSKCSFHQIIHVVLDDFAIVDGEGSITRILADRALKLLDVDTIGLDQMDRRYLEMLAVNFGGGPVGIETLAAALSEPRDAIEDIIEPFLLQQGFLQRTPRGRLLTARAFRHLGLAEPARDATQIGLFGDGPDEG